jgi:hypothetical protein
MDRAAVALVEAARTLLDKADPRTLMEVPDV